MKPQVKENTKQLKTIAELRKEFETLREKNKHLFIKKD